MRYYFEAKASSQIGSREKNEDRFYNSRYILAISDGMGGHTAGEIASETLIDFIVKNQNRFTSMDQESILEELPKSIYMANKKIADKVVENKDLKGMGATLTILMIINYQNIYLLHVGDSRCYRINKLEDRKDTATSKHVKSPDFEAQQLTRDHTFAQSMIDYGIIDKPLNNYDPRNSLLTHVLNGNNDILQFDLFRVNAKVGDYFLLSTDGFHNILDKEYYMKYIQDHDGKTNNLDSILENLLDELKNKYLQDNATFILGQLKVEKD